MRVFYVGRRRILNYYIEILNMLRIKMIFLASIEKYIILQPAVVCEFGISLSSIFSIFAFHHINTVNLSKCYEIHYKLIILGYRTLLGIYRYSTVVAGTYINTYFTKPQLLNN